MDITLVTLYLLTCCLSLLHSETTIEPLNKTKTSEGRLPSSTSATFMSSIASIEYTTSVSSTARPNITTTGRNLESTQGEKLTSFDERKETTDHKSSVPKRKPETFTSTSNKHTATASYTDREKFTSSISGTSELSSVPKDEERTVRDIKYITTENTELYWETTDGETTIQDTISITSSDITEFSSLSIDEETTNQDTTTATRSDMTETASTPIETTTADEPLISYPILDASRLDTFSDLYIGMRATIRLTLSLPAGYYQGLLLYMSQSKHEENFDVITKECRMGQTIQHKRTYPGDSRMYRNTGFLKYTYASLYVDDVIVSPSANLTDQQFTCDYYVYFNNAKSLSDGQIAITNYGAEAPSQPIRKVLLGEIGLRVKTTILQMNKTGSYAVDEETSTNLTSRIKYTSTIIFKAWIPYYNPKLKVRLNGENIEAIYATVKKLGRNYHPGADIQFLETCGTRYSEAILQLPSHWVNRGYYDSENTTNDDIIVFAAEVALSETAIIGADNNINISLFIDNIQVWTSTVSLVALKSNSSVPDGVYIRSDSSQELSPSGHVTFFLEISIPGGSADILNITLLTKESTNIKSSPLVIKNVALSSSDKLLCVLFENYSENVSNRESSNQSATYINIKYLNDDEESKLKMQFDVSLDHEKVSFGDAYVIAVHAGMKSTEEKVNINKPDIFNDGNKTTLSNIHQILDGNDTTCLRLPLKGERPPFLLMTMLTSWLSIETKAYDVIIRGDEISCASHKNQNLQVSYPTSGTVESFQGSFNICDLKNKNKTSPGNLTECSYRCNCESNVECSEMILFMTIKEETGGWSLCELSANNF